MPKTTQRTDTDEAEARFRKIREDYELSQIEEYRMLMPPEAWAQASAKVVADIARGRQTQMAVTMEQLTADLVQLGRDTEIAPGSLKAVVEKALGDR